MDLRTVQAAQLLGQHAWRCRSPTGCSSATSCCCRCGCSSTWATPPRWPAWCWRPWACWRSAHAVRRASIVNRVDPRIFVTVSFAIFAMVLLHARAFQHRRRSLARCSSRRSSRARRWRFLHAADHAELSGLPPERIPAASGLFNFARITAGSFGTSITTTLWDRRATLHHAQLVEHLNADDPTSAQALSRRCRRGWTRSRATRR